MKSFPVVSHIRSVWLSSILLCVAFFPAGGCSVAESKVEPSAEAARSASDAVAADAASAPRGATISIDPNGPADTVRAFYQHLRENRFREALFLTNLRPAIEGLTDNELKDFALDFEAIAGQVPAEVAINGEIIAGDHATVTANLPNNKTDKHEIQSLKLRKENDVWVIAMVDDEAARKIKQSGKNYFYQLRIDTHQDEARKMLERISKAQLVHSLQNGGLVADMETLIAAGLLPEDVRSSASTGYEYVINTAADKRSYYATGTPAEYGKSGKLSFLLQVDGKGISHITSKDNRGKPVR